MVRMKMEARAAGDARRGKRWRQRQDSDGLGRVIEASVIVSVGGGDVDATLLARMQDFLQKETCDGLCAGEHGGIAFNLHFQMVVRMWATSLIAINRKMREYLSGDVQKLAGGLILCRALKQRDMHTFRGMVGFVAEDMQSNAQPRIDWFRGRWDESRRESILAEGDVANVCDSTNHVDEDIPDFQPGDPYLPLVHSCGVNAIALSTMVG
ncbi:hypothetical protein L7F22_023564 [Adiantum nelumboides]|nr:hypothetical protein [Adiantum nelumboides]